MAAVKAGTAVLLALVWVIGGRRVNVFPLFFLRVVVTEYGHWLAVVAVAMAVVPVGAPGILEGVLLVEAALFCIPLVTARRLAKRRGRKVRATVAFSLRGLAAPPLRRLTFPGPGGDLEIDFFPSGGAEPRPCMVVVHGGGWVSGRTDENVGWDSLWTHRGWHVASVSYRLAPADQWPAPREDVIAAIRHLQAESDNLGIDPARLVLFGRSAGGQIASVVAVSGEVKGILGCICFYAPFDMEFAYRHGDENDILRSLALLRSYLGGPLDAVPGSYRDASAFHLVTPASPPFLLLHGKRDELVWVRQSRRFFRRLRAIGVPCTYEELPWATHAFDWNVRGPGGQWARAAVEKFLAECLQNPLGRCLDSNSVEF